MGNDNWIDQENIYLYNSNNLRKQRIKYLGINIAADEHQKKMKERRRVFVFVCIALLFIILCSLYFMFYGSTTGQDELLGVDGEQITIFIKRSYKGDVSAKEVVSSINKIQSSLKTMYTTNIKLAEESERLNAGEISKQEFLIELAKAQELFTETYHELSSINVPEELTEYSEAVKNFSLFHYAMLTHFENVVKTGDSKAEKDYILFADKTEEYQNQVQIKLEKVFKDIGIKCNQISDKVWEYTFQ